MEAFFRKCLIQGPVLSQTYSTLNLGQTDIAPIKKTEKMHIHKFSKCISTQAISTSVQW